MKKLILSLAAITCYGTMFSADIIVYGRNNGLTVTSEGGKMTINIDCDNWHQEK